MERTSGILLHPTALPGPFLIGDFGREAFQFIDFLVSAGQSIWQVLPLGPTGYGHSPYNTLSAFAGNPTLINLQQLVECGDIDNSRLETFKKDNTEADFDQILANKNNLLLEAGRHFFTKTPAKRHKDFEAFCQEQSYWLDDFSLFMALRDNFAGQPWSKWPKQLRTRQPDALKECQEKFAEHCRLLKYQQFVFTEQWNLLKRYANNSGILIFGDIPIFVAYDSADVWANQHLFQLDENGRATAVAGVPPDYFSKTGQRWGNPLYRWEEHQAEDFRWWLSRFAHQMNCCDLVRIDHFRGFQACWSIPADEKTAINGRWEEVPGRDLFTRLSEQRADLPIIAEDLGVITPEVEHLRDDFNFPGMKILQFAFDSGPDNPYLLQNHIANSVVYTGTHDNNTTLGWWQNLTKKQKDLVRDQLGERRPKMPWKLIELAMSSIANLCMIPCQDILNCDSAARFNTPGHATGNWEWQMTAGALTEELANQLHKLTEEHHRKPRR